jgi:hypothetical protein
MVVAELLLAVVAARARIDQTEVRTVAEPIPLADIGLAGKEADTDSSSYPLGSYEDSAECCVPSAQEPSEVPQCHPAVHGEPNALGRFGSRIAAQVAPQVLRTRPMHWPTPGAESAERSAVAPESVGSAEAAALAVFAESVGDAAVLMVLAELVARPVVGSAV